MLDDDVDQRGLAASHKPYGEAFVGIRSIDFDACDFTIWNQVKQPREDCNGQKQYLFQTSTSQASLATLNAKLNG